MEFNLKNLEPNDPLELYNKLEKLVRFGDLHAVAKGEKDEVQGYYLGGLLVNDIKKSSVSSETINTLYSALRSYDIEHAILPNDIHKGQIPIILDDHTRSYLNSNLKELVEYENLAWRIFFIPMKIDVDDDELSHAEIVFDKSEDDVYEYFSIHYSRIANHLSNLVSDNVGKLDDSYVQKSEESSESNEVEQTPSKYEYDNSLDSISFDDSDDSTDVLGDESEDNDLTQEDIINEDSESSKEDKDEVESVEIEVDEEDDSIKSDKELEVDSDLAMEDEDIDNEYTELPPELQATFDDFYLGRFNEFENVDENDTTHVILQKEIKNANNVLEVREREFKRRAKQLYMQYMSESYNEINKVIDVENGDAIIKDMHEEMENNKNNLDMNLVQRIDSHKQELEHRFWNEHFNSFKEQTLAGLAMKFEKEEYYNLVAEPLERFEELERSRNEEAKYELTHELSNKFANIKTQAITKDRNNAILEVQNYLNAATQEIQGEIRELDSKMTEQNERFIQYEYGKKAEERLRNTVGSDLYTDEQAKKYKKQFELTEKEKEEATTKLKELEEKYKEDISTKNEEYNKFKKDIEANHQSVLKSKDEELSNLSKDLTSLQSENEKNKTELDNSKKTKRKHVIGTGVGAFLISAVVFGGAALGFHNQSQSAEDKLESTNKVVEQHKDEATKNKEELEQIKKEKEDESKKQQKIIDDQKKELEKQKKDKKDKK